MARVGSDEIGMDPMGLNETDIFMVLRPKSEWRMRSKDELVAAIRSVLDDFPGVAYGFTQPIEMRVSEMLTGVRGDVALKLFGSDLETLNTYATEIAEELRNIEGSEDVFTSQNEGVQYFELVVDRLTAGRLGLTVEELQRILRAQLEGLPLGIIQEGARRTPLVLRAPASVSASPMSFATLPVSLGEGLQVPLGTLAELRRVEGVVSVNRERGQRFTVVRTNVANRDLVGFVDEARQRVATNVDLPEGYYVEWGGQFENQQRAASRLAIVVPIGVGLIFLLLFSTFRSIRPGAAGPDEHPTRTNRWCIRAMDNRGVFVRTRISRVYRTAGYRRDERRHVGGVLQSAARARSAHGRSRGRRRKASPATGPDDGKHSGLPASRRCSSQPGPGSEIQRPLAIVVIGGLITATTLTLIILPILYRRFGFAAAAS